MLDQTIDQSVTERVFSVTELNGLVKEILEGSLASIFIEGEISNWMCSAYGHWYFTLKDAKAQIRCAMFRHRNQRLGFKPENGQQVLLKVTVSLYEPRGDYQLMVDSMELSGDGALQRRFEQLKQKLHADGLFDASHKQTLPAMPKAIGVVTSPTGAAIRDILNILQRRFPLLPIFLYPTSVQGDAAPGEIARAIEFANRDGRCDVLIVGRGGGSIEDLWAFNEEIVARSIFASNIPIISAVGHEIDITISDFVADLRAPTPSAAAELVSPDQVDLLQMLEASQRSLARLIQQITHQTRQQLNWLAKQLSSPLQSVQSNMQRVDDWSRQMLRMWQQMVQQRHQQMTHLQHRIHQQHPRVVLDKMREQLDQAQQKLTFVMQKQFQQAEQQLQLMAKSLETTSPLATLSRGYAIATKTSAASTKKHQVVDDISKLKMGDKVNVRVKNGEFQAIVSKIS